MIDREREYRRWAELMDRRAAGEPLSADEQRFCDHFSEQHPACAREVQLLAELSDLDAAPNEESRALVDATLERLGAEAAQAERTELSRLRGRPRVPRAWLLGAAAAAVAVLAFGVALPRMRPRPPELSPGPAPTRIELVYVSGDVRVNGVRLPIGSSAFLAEGSRLSVADGAAACVAMDPDIDVCARAGSELVLSRTRSPWRRIDLLRGKVGVQLAPQPDGYHLSVVAADVWSTAVGTAFTVENEGHGVRTAVMNGKVRVGRDGRNEQLVGAHQRADVLGASAGLLVPVGRSEEASEWALLRPAALWHNPVSSTLVLHGQPTAAEVVLDEQPIGLAPLASLIPAGTHRLQVRLEGRTVLERELVSEVGQTSTVTYDATPAVAEPSAPEPAHAKRAVRRQSNTAQASERSESSAADILRDAYRLMRAESFDAAAKQYESLRAAYPDSPEASTVLVSLAELQLDRLGRPALALENLDRYLSGRAQGLAEEARQVRIRALRALGEREREGSAIEEFLRLHPRSFRAAALQRRLTDLQAAH